MKCPKCNGSNYDFSGGKLECFDCKKVFVLVLDKEAKTK